jgi:tRNA(Ile)-lysidine synthase
VAVSGGPDSVALLLLAHAAFPGITEAATVDHQLRAASASEAASVAALCASLGIPHATLCPDTPITGNLQSAAREARYVLLERWADARELDWIATAHHADDQLETLLMRLNRGSGLGGLAGVRPRHGRIIRPLLGWRRAELGRIVEQAGITPIDDPSNRDERFDRARMRGALAEAGWLDPVSATRSAAALAEAEAALQWVTEAYAGRRVAAQSGVVSLDPRALPAELLRRLTLHCLRQIEPSASPRGDELDRLLTGLAEGRTATLSGVKCSGGDFWLFSAAPARRTN